MAQGDGQLMQGLGNLIGSITAPIREKNQQEFEIRRSEVLTKLDNERQSLMMNMQALIEERARNEERVHQLKVKTGELGMRINRPELNDTGGLSGALGAPGDTINSRIEKIDGSISQLKGSIDMYTTSMQDFMAGADAFAVDTDTWASWMETQGLITPDEVFERFKLMNPEYRNKGVEDVQDDMYWQGFFKAATNRSELESAMDRQKNRQKIDSEIDANKANERYLNQQIAESAARLELIPLQRDGMILANETAFYQLKPLKIDDSNKELMDIFAEASANPVFREVGMIFSDQLTDAKTKTDQIDQVLTKYRNSAEYKGERSHVAESLRTLTALSSIVSDERNFNNMLVLIDDLTKNGGRIDEDVIIDIMMALPTLGTDGNVAQAWDAHTRNIPKADAEAAYDAFNGKIFKNPQRVGAMVTSAQAHIEVTTNEFMHSQKGRDLVSAIQKNLLESRMMEMSERNLRNTNADAEYIVRTVIGPLVAATRASDGSSREMMETVFFINNSRSFGSTAVERQATLNGMMQIDKINNINRSMTYDEYRDPALRQELYHRNEKVRGSYVEYKDIMYNSMIFSDVNDRVRDGLRRTGNKKYK